MLLIERRLFHQSKIGHNGSVVTTTGDLVASSVIPRYNFTKYTK